MKFTFLTHELRFIHCSSRSGHWYQQEKCEIRRNENVQLLETWEEHSFPPVPTRSDSCSRIGRGGTPVLRSLSFWGLSSHGGFYLWGLCIVFDFKAHKNNLPKRLLFPIKVLMKTTPRGRHIRHWFPFHGWENWAQEVKLLAQDNTVSHRQRRTPKLDFQSSLLLVFPH